MANFSIELGPYPDESEDTIAGWFELRAKISQDEYYELDSMVEIITNGDESVWESFRKHSGQRQVTLIHVAAYSGRVKMLKRAIELGASLDERDRYGDTALYYAAVIGSVEIVRWLLHDHWDKGTANAQVLYKNFVGNTALHKAIQGLAYHSTRYSGRRNSEHTLTKRDRNLEVMRLLLDAGADADAQSVIFDSDKSIRSSPLLLVGIMLSFGSPNNGSIWYEKTVDILISKGASVKLDEDDLFGSTILHHAAYMGCHKTIRLVVEAYEQQTKTKLDASVIDSKDKYECTPLHQAAEYNHAECVRALIDYGASLSAENRRKESVINVLLKNCESATALLEDILDARVRSIHAQRPAAIQIVELDFAVLAPPHEPRMAAVLALTNAAIASNTTAIAVLQHPLVRAFLGLTWYAGLHQTPKYGSLLGLFLLLVIALDFGIIMIGAAELEYEGVIRTLQFSLLLRSIILILLNLVTFAIMPKFFLQQFQNYVSMVGVVAGLASQYYPLLRLSVGIVIVSIPIEFMLRFGRFIKGVHWYTQLFTIVLQHVCKALFIYSFIICGFGLSFVILLNGKPGFKNLASTLLKTFAMMSGEYDIGSLLESGGDDTVAEESKNLWPISIGSYVILVLFMVIVSIVVMNLITALAIADVRELEEKGKLFWLLKLIQWRANLESFQRKYQAGKWDQRLPGLLRITKIDTKVELDLISDEKLPEGISAQLRKALLDVASKNLKK